MKMQRNPDNYIRQVYMYMYVLWFHQQLLIRSLKEAI
jgi:hypothetical protein